MNYTRVKHEDYLNMLGIPEDDKKSNGGRISDYAKYGTWLRKKDPIAFEVSYHEEKQTSDKTKEFPIKEITRLSELYLKLNNEGLLSTEENKEFATLIDELQAILPVSTQ